MRGSEYRVVTVGTSGDVRVVHKDELPFGGRIT